MTQRFGALAELEPAGGYFYLCPSCYGDRIQPHIDALPGGGAESPPEPADG